jgi:hypothetical protein
LSRTPVAPEIRPRIDKMGLYKMKKILHIRITRMKRKLIRWEKIFASYSSDRRSTSRIFKELKKLNMKRTNNLVNKWTNELRS